MSDEVVYIESAMCPVPIRDRGYVIMGHGSGGKLSQDLISGLFLPPFDNPALRAGNDAGVVDVAPGIVWRSVRIRMWCGLCFSPAAISAV